MLSEAPIRLRQERARLELNQADFGRFGGVSKNTQMAYESGASPIPLDYLAKLEPHGIDLAFIALGQRTISAPVNQRGRIIDRATLENNLVDVRQIDLRFGLGGAIMDTEIVEHQAETMAFPAAWLRKITATSPSMLYWASGVGNSMEPAISDGDIILIDRSQITPVYADLIWAVSYGQLAMIKRLRPMPDGGIKILSDNPSVPPETAYDGELHIFGRVVAVVRRF